MQKGAHNDSFLLGRGGGEGGGEGAASDLTLKAFLSLGAILQPKSPILEPPVRLCGLSLGGCQDHQLREGFLCIMWHTCRASERAKAHKDACNAHPVSLKQP